MTLKVFITGATGYIGGEVLYQLLNLDLDVDVYASVRSKTKGDDLVAKTNGKVKPIVTDLDDLDQLAEHVSKSDIIINTANVDHVPSADIIAKTLINLKTPKFLVHTSGTSILGDGLAESKSKPTAKLYYDDKSIDLINSFPAEQPHRPVDEIILGINEKNPLIKTAIICPSTIFGISNGFGRIISQQIPYLMVLAIQNKQTPITYDGKYIWNHVHIKDLGELYILVLSGLIKGDDIPQGKQGYYFGSYKIENETIDDAQPSSIEHTWYGVAEKVGELLYSKKLVDTPKVRESTPEYLINLKDNDPFTPYMWGTNSRSRGNNGYKIGWSPKYTSLSDFYDSFEKDLDIILREGMDKQKLPTL